MLTSERPLTIVSSGQIYFKLILVLSLKCDINLDSEYLLYSQQPEKGFNIVQAWPHFIDLYTCSYILMKNTLRWLGCSLFDGEDDNLLHVFIRYLVFDA